MRCSRDCESRLHSIRSLARLLRVAPGQWGRSRGGSALQLRMSNRARTTRDIDFAWQVQEDELIHRLIAGND